MDCKFARIERIGTVSITAAPRKAGAPDPLALRANPATVPGVKLVRLVRLVRLVSLDRLVRLVRVVVRVYLYCSILHVMCPGLPMR